MKSTKIVLLAAIAGMIFVNCTGAQLPSAVAENIWKIDANILAIW